MIRQSKVKLTCEVAHPLTVPEADMNASVSQLSLLVQPSHARPTTSPLTSHLNLPRSKLCYAEYPATTIFSAMLKTPNPQQKCLSKAAPTAS